MPIGAWDPEPVRREAMDAMERKMTAACVAVQSRAKKLLSTAGTGRRRGKKGRFVRHYGANPSAPGDPPKKQTGRLRGSVAYEIVRERGRIIGRVGTNVKYGLFLEIGTRKMKARPWLRRALAESADQIRRILG